MLQLLRNIPWIECSVGAAVSVAEGKETYTAYEVSLSVRRDAFKPGTHTVRHRYSRFAALHEALVKAWGKQVELPKLPAKGGLFALSARQIEARQAGLELYLKQLVTVLNWAVEPNLRAFFECDRWLKERKTRPVGA